MKKIDRCTERFTAKKEVAKTHSEFVKLETKEGQRTCREITLKRLCSSLSISKHKDGNRVMSEKSVEKMEEIQE